MMTVSVVRRIAAAGLVACCAGLAVGAKYNPAPAGAPARVNLAASAAGNVALTRAAVRLYGSGSFNAVQVYAPIMQDRLDGFFNNAAAEVVNGNPKVMNTTFCDVFPSPPRTTPDDEKLFQHWGLGQFNIVAVGTPTGNDVLIDESIEFPGPGGFPSVAEGLVDPNGVYNASHRDWSNGMGSILTDGTALFRSNFNSQRLPSQNNIEFVSALGTTAASGGTKVFSALNGIDNQGAGSSFLSPPSGVRLNNGNLLVCQGSFGTNGFKDGVNVWIYNNTLQNWTLPPLRWPTANYPRISDLNGAYPTTGQLRTSNHRATKLVRAGCSTETAYITFGEGSTTSTSAAPNNHLFSGSGFAPRVFFVDTIDVSAGTNLNSFTNGYAFIAADPAAAIIPAVGATPERIGPINPNYRFLEIQGTGSNGFALHDINVKGQVVCLWADFTNTVAPVYEIRRYDPIFDTNNACKIIGYQTPVVIAKNGVDYGGTTFVTSNEAFVTGQCNPIPPQTAPALGTALNQCFSGVSIDDEGNISFVGTTQAFEVDVTFTDTCDPFNPIPLGTAPDTRSAVTSLCYYHAASNSLFRLVDGGQNGDTLASTNGGPAYRIGQMPTDNNASDGFGAEGMSETGGWMGISVRDCADEANTDSNTDGFSQDGGTLNPGLANETSVRATLFVNVGAYTPSCPCTADINGDCIVNTADLTALLGNFGRTCGANPNPPCPLAGDLNGDNTVNTADLTTLLGQFGRQNVGGVCQ